jgi:hypothetical protein
LGQPDPEPRLRLDFGVGNLLVGDVTYLETGKTASVDSPQSRATVDSGHRTADPEDAIHGSPDDIAAAGSLSP